MSHSRTAAIAFLVFMTISILIMVTFVIIILFLIQKKQRGFINDLITVKASYDRELYKAQLEIQEQTFQEISREIHDNVGQMLSLAKLGLGTLDFERTEEAKESISEISDILEKALEDLRHMSRSMNAEIIKNGGLKKSIEMQMGFLQRGGKFRIQFEVNGEPARLPETKEIILFRIVQEAVNNIIRHSTATNICISLYYSKNLFKLKIKDNGKGFMINQEFSEATNMNGIYNMQQRAKLIDAIFDMESKIGNGTTITVTTPY
jgi:two-component system, NarL family, sensor kinase